MPKRAGNAKVTIQGILLLARMLLTLHPVKCFRPRMRESRWSGDRNGGLRSPEAASLFMLRLCFVYASLVLR